MADTNNLLSFAKLRGREKNTTLKTAMQNLLSLDGLWTAVIGIELNMEKIAKAKAKIVLSVDEILYVHVANAATAKDAWNNLLHAFEDTGLGKSGCFARLLLHAWIVVILWRNI